MIARMLGLSPGIWILLLLALLFAFGVFDRKAR